MEKLINIAAIVPNNFGHKAGDGTKTRRHHLKEIHPALQANCGGTQMTFLLQVEESELSRWKFKIIP